jgi:D-alanyl-D-alanine carboxypeptidase
MQAKKSRRYVAIILLASAAGCATAGSATAHPPTSHDEIASVLQQGVDAIHAAGGVGVLAQVDTSAGAIEARSGVANLTTGQPVPWDAETRVASATKTFTAVVLLQLVGEGKLSLDDTVSHWLPGVVSGHGNDGAAITIRELLQHTSGIYDYSRYVAATSARGYQATMFRSYTPGQLVALAMRHVPLFSAGKGWSYSNTNYILAGMIIQKVTGESWAQEVNARIIKPLGLRHTFTPGSSPFIPGPHAEGYAKFGTRTWTDTTVMNMTVAWSAGAIISTNEDMHRFLSALLDGKLLRPAQLAEMLTTTGEPDGGPSGMRYGLGLQWTPLSCGGGYYGHSGDALGYHFRDGITPDGRRDVMVSYTGDFSKQTSAAAVALIDHELCETR